MKRLNSPQFLDPRDFNKIRNGDFKAIVKDGKIKLSSGYCTFIDEPYPDGEEIILSAGANLYAESIVDIEKKIAEQKAIARQKEEEQRVLENERVRLAWEFNDSLNIPVKWTPEIKPVLSGLTENSMGNGCKKNTVFHIFLLEDLKDGKLKRKKGQPLCGNDMGKFGELAQSDDPLRREQALKVSCKACLKIAERWQEPEHMPGF